MLFRRLTDPLTMLFPAAAAFLLACGAAPGWAAAGLSPDATRGNASDVSVAASSVGSAGSQNASSAAPSAGPAPVLRTAAQGTAAEVTALGTDPTAAGTAPVRIAVLSTLGNAMSAQTFSSSVKALEAAWARPTEVRYYNLPGLEKALAAGQADFFISNAGFFEAQQSTGRARLLASLKIPQAADPNRSMAGLIVVPAGSLIHTLDDLKGKTAVAVASGAFGGYRLSLGEIAAKGYDPDTFFKSVAFIGYPMQSVFEAVRSGAGDAGLVRACLFEDMAAAGQLKPSEWRLIGARTGDGLTCAHSTDLYPDWVFASVSDVPAELSRRAAATLLSMPGNNGTYWSIATDFRAVDKLNRDLKIGRYAYLRKTTLSDFIVRNLFWLGLAGIGLVLILLHYAVVNREVKRKTASLHRALEAQAAARRQAVDTMTRLRRLERVSLAGMLSNMVAHELKQPLGAISNYAGGIRMLNAAGNNGALIDEAAAEILGQTARAAAIVERVRSYAGARSRHPEPVSVAALTARTLKEFEELTGRALPAQTDVPADLTVTADATELGLVLLNLLKNADEACRQVEKPVISIRAEADGNKVLIAIADNGPAPPPEVLTHLFDPKISGKKDGLGLGLAISARLVEQIGGTLSMTADPESGVTAVIRLPLCETQPSEPIHA